MRMYIGFVLVIALLGAYHVNSQLVDLKPEVKNTFGATNKGDGTQVDAISLAWNAFKSFFKREFDNAIDEGERFFIFARKFLQISSHNAEYSKGLKSYELGINKFTDMRESELMKLRGYRPTLKLHRYAPVGSTFIPPSIPVDLPKSVDWRKKGAVTPVKNQGQCGSCWAFSTTGSLEGQHFRKTGKLVSLSEQQLVDCSAKYGNMGCNGGLMDNAFEYIQDNHGVDTEEAYPYVSGETGDAEDKCYFKRRTVGANDTGFVDIPQNDERALKKAVATVGPVSVAINAAQPDFMSYKSGIYDPEDCPGGPMDLDHGVLVVGYGTEDGKDYWIVKNSWGPEWGENGYIRMARNKDNLCGIASSASYPLV